MRVVYCGKHVHCWSSPRPEDLGHYLLWAGLAKIGGPLSCSDSPECVWPEWLCPEFVAIGTDPLLDVTGYGNWSHPVC